MIKFLHALALLFYIFGSSTNAETGPGKAIKTSDFIKIFELKIAKYSLSLPKLPNAQGYNLKYEIVVLNQLERKVYSLSSGYLGLGDGNADLLIKYPSKVTSSNELDFELGEEFVFGIRAQGYDGLSKISKNINQRLNDLRELETPMIIVFQGKITRAR